MWNEVQWKVCDGPWGGLYPRYETCARLLPSADCASKRSPVPMNPLHRWQRQKVKLHRLRSSNELCNVVQTRSSTLVDVTTFYMSCHIFPISTINFTIRVFILEPPEKRITSHNQRCIELYQSKTWSAKVYWDYHAWSFQGNRIFILPS